MKTDTDPLRPVVPIEAVQPASGPSVVAHGSEEAATAPLLSLAGGGEAMLGPLLDVAAARGLVRIVLDVRSDRFEIWGLANPTRRMPPLRLFRDQSEGLAGGRELLAYVQRLAGIRPGRPPHPVTGTFRFDVAGSMRDFEVVVVPTLRGEQAAIELCPACCSARSLEELGFAPGDLARVRALLGRRSGFLALVGDPGNGKTTLYRAILHALVRERRRTVSVQGSAEAPLDDVVVIRRPEGDLLPHEAWVDAALRLGSEVAGFDDLPGRAACARAVRGALDRTLVIYSLALPDVPSAARYLDELPLRSGFVAAALEGVIALRLVRQVCSECAESVALPLELTAAVATVLEGLDEQPAWVQGKGCVKCGHTGTEGTRLLFEVGVLEDAARRTLIEGRGHEDLSGLLAASRADTIRAQAVRLAAEGCVPVSELARVL